MHGHMNVKIVSYCLVFFYSPRSLPLFNTEILYNFLDWYLCSASALSTRGNNKTNVNIAHASNGIPTSDSGIKKIPKPKAP